MKRPDPETITALKKYYASRLRILCLVETDWELDLALRGHGLNDRDKLMLKRHVRKKQRTTK